MATRGSDQKLQNQLKKLGYFTGSVNGKYGSSTRSAVKTLQVANHLTASGTADAATRKLLNGGKAVSKKTYQSRKKKVEKAIALAKTKLGKRYVLGEDGPDTFDCSGFTSYAFTKSGPCPGWKRQGARLRGRDQAQTQPAQTRRFGIFDTIKDNDLCDHVGIYLVPTSLSMHRPPRVRWSSAPSAEFMRIPFPGGGA